MTRVDDPGRIAAVRRLGLQDADTTPFDRLARLARAHLGVPVACVALVDTDHQVIIGEAGLTDPFSSSRRVPARYSYCRHVVQTDAPLLVDDARDHPLFRAHPALLELGVRAYLGFPLRSSDGHVLGSFFALDLEPRSWTQENLAFLADLTAAAITEVELRRELLERSRIEAERARAEQDRAAAESRTTTILENITDAFLALDADWRFTYLNAAAERLVQRSRAELLGECLWQAFPAALGTPFETAYRQAVARGETVVFEAYYPPLEGWYSVHAYPSDNGLSVYFQDVTDRKRAEAKQAALEAHYRQLATNVPQAVYAVNAAGLFTEVNPATERLLSRPAAELLGASLSTVIAADDLPAVNRVLLDITAGRADNISFEARVTQPTGEERRVAITATALRGDAGISGLLGIARDVSDERAQERALRESEARFRQIADNVREVFWIFTPDFSSALYVSPAYHAMTGLDVAEVYAHARAFLEPVHEEDRPALLAAMRRIRDEPIEQEFRFHHADGSERWFLARGYPVRDENGAVFRVVGTSEDITARKLSERALHESERRLQQILDALPVGVILADAEGHLRWHNPASDRIWGGVRAADLAGYGQYVGWWADSGRRVRADEWPLARAVRGETVTAEVADIDGFDGVRRTVRLSAVPLRDELDRITGAIVVQEDITEARRRDAQQRLLAAALNGIREGVCLLSPEGELVYANRTAMRIMGVEPARLPGLRLAELASAPGMLEGQREALNAALQHGRWSGRIRHTRLNDRSEVPVDVVIGCLDPDGPGAGLLYALLQDATEPIQREQQLRRAERMASVGTLVGGVAHELNNPLAAVLNFTQLMLLEERPSQDQETLSIIQREAERMSKIVSNLKLIARPTQNEVCKGAVDLNDVVQHVLKVHGYRLLTGNIEVRLDLARDLPLVHADRGAMEQLLINLVVNAEQAISSTSRSGTLLVGTRTSRLGATVHVMDDGPGIPRADLERIWDPFWTTKAPREGIGLGLSLVHSIVAEHGGIIEVDSEPGSGTVFRIDLPSAPEPEPQQSSPTAAPEPVAPLRVLVVDDESSVRLVMARYLTRRGHAVEQAADGAAALQLLEHSSFDVILSDLRMPGLGGEAMMEQLRQRGLADTVIFITGDAGDAGERLQRAGARVLLKPIELAHLARAVEGLAIRA